MITMIPIGVVRATRTAVKDDEWDAVTSSIELDAGVVGGDAVLALETFSHIEVVFVFDRVDPESIERGARHPRNNEAWPKVGILAQRAKMRPNRIGTTICRLETVEGGAAPRLHVRGMDAIDGTPVLDIKPWVREFGPRGEVRQPEWMTELMTRYWT